jgi:hypothetical protein
MTEKSIAGWGEPVGLRSGSRRFACAGWAALLGAFLLRTSHPAATAPAFIEHLVVCVPPCCVIVLVVYSVLYGRPSRDLGELVPDDPDAAGSGSDGQGQDTRSGESVESAYAPPNLQHGTLPRHWLTCVLWISVACVVLWNSRRPSTSVLGHTAT